MIVLGALAACVAVAAAILSLRRESEVARWVGLVAGPSRRRIPRPADETVAARAAGALGGALAGSILASVSGMALLIVVGGYLGWVAPSLAVERRASARRRDAERAVVTLVEWLHALVSSGRPAEIALSDLTARGAVDGVLREVLERVRRDYLLGVPMHEALVREAKAVNVHGLAELASRLDSARDLGRGALPLLAELRDDLRARERAAALRSASAVEGKLTAVMTLCYLPALALLVIVPLFVTLLAGLFGS